MCKGCAVTMKEMKEIVMNISQEFSLSPKDFFITFQRHGKDKC